MRFLTTIVLAATLLPTLARCGGASVAELRPPAADERHANRPVEDWVDVCTAHAHSATDVTLGDAQHQVERARAEALERFAGGPRDPAVYRAWLDDWLYTSPVWVRITADRVVLAEDVAGALVAGAARDGDTGVAREVLLLAGAPLDTPRRLAPCWDALESL